MKGSKANRYGVCQLTGMRGKFVKSHIIPRAFTKPEVAGDPIWQAGSGKPVTKRYDSWYDPELCTQDGENVLERIDGAATTELRRHKMVWSGWGEADALGSDHTQFGESPYGMRALDGVNIPLLRAFFLSLLWRAAASTRFEFAEVQLPPADLELMRELILSGDQGRIDFYPVSLTQLSTRGPSHNLTPIKQTKHIPAVEDSPAWLVGIIRFYFDGLIAHFHNHNCDDGKTARLGPVIVGGSDKITITTITYEASFQAANIANIWAEALSPGDPR